MASEQAVNNEVVPPLRGRTESRRSQDAGRKEEAAGCPSQPRSRQSACPLRAARVLAGIGSRSAGNRIQCDSSAAAAPPEVLCGAAPFQDATDFPLVAGLDCAGGRRRGRGDARAERLISGWVSSGWVVVRVWSGGLAVVRGFWRSDVFAGGGSLIGTAFFGACTYRREGN